MKAGLASKKIILLEFNELCPALLEKWMDDGSLPNFRRFFEGSQAFITTADAAPPALEPWIQWYSLHTGLSYQQHGVFRLTDGPRAAYPDIWEVIRNAGLTVFNCSSMNAKSFASNGSLFVPDPWSTSESAHPTELNRFHAFVAKQVQEHTNKQLRSHLREHRQFVTFLLTHGLRATTIRKIAGQILAEKLGDGSERWKRVIVLDWLQTDIFLHYWRKHRPSFSTFFLNSTAHFQHSYWRYMEPALFAAPADQRDVQRFRSAIKTGYRNMDSLLGDFFDLESQHGATLVLATALSQQPYLKHETIGGQRFYRPFDIRKLLEMCGVHPKAIEPTMTHQYMIHFESRAAQEAAAAKISQLTCGDESLFDLDRRSGHSIYLGCQLRKPVPDEATINQGLDNASRLPFYDHFHLIDQTKSGYHHPDGVLWIKFGEHAVHNGKVSILDIFPTILDLLEIRYDPHPSHPYRGHSLLAEPSIAKVSLAH